MVLGSLATPEMMRRQDRLMPDRVPGLVADATLVGGYLCKKAD